MSDLKTLQKRATEISEKYRVLNARQGKDAWGIKDKTMGFAVDVGELLELIMAKENLRGVDDVDEKLSHELSDCLWSILTIADHYGIDLERSFSKTMDELDARIEGQMR